MDGEYGGEADGVDGQVGGRAGDASSVLDEICGYPCRPWRCYVGVVLGFGVLGFVDLGVGVGEEDGRLKREKRKREGKETERVL